MWSALWGVTVGHKHGSSSIGTSATLVAPLREEKTMERRIVGAWKITTKDGQVWGTDRLEGELLDTAIAHATATFGDGCTVEPW
jgi:hypothetical protein